METAKVHATKALYFLDTLNEDIDEKIRTNFEKLRLAHDQWKQLAIRAMNDSKNPSKYLTI